MKDHIDHMVRITVFAGFALFGLRGLLPQNALATVVSCILLAAVGEYLYVRCSSPSGCPIGELAKRRGWITDDAIRAVLSRQRHDGGRFGEIAVRQRFLTASQLNDLLQSRAG